MKCFGEDSPGGEEQRDILTAEGYGIHMETPTALQHPEQMLMADYLQFLLGTLQK